MATKQAKLDSRDHALIAETGWGKGISPVARAAVARYCLEIGADPVRHVDVLGGSVYLNAEFYIEPGRGESGVRPRRGGFHPRRCPRHAGGAAAPEGRPRCNYGVPEKAPGAALVTLHYRNRGPFIGVNWAGVRDNDPVGKQEPTKTAHTRAYRKAALKAESAWFRQHPRLQAAEQILVQGRELEKLAPPDDSPPLVNVQEGLDVKAADNRRPVGDGETPEIGPMRDLGRPIQDDLL